MPSRIFTRGYLPHWDLGETPQFVTWRLADSLPAVLYDSWWEELKALPEEDRKRQCYSRAEKYLDSGQGSCILRNPVASKIVQDALLEKNGEMWLVHGWTIMPNHVHTLLTPLSPHALGMVIKQIKGPSSRYVNAALGRKGRLWQPEYFDRAIRDDVHFERVLRYIEWNPVKAGLCGDPKHWAFGTGNPLAREKLARVPHLTGTPD